MPLTPGTSLGAYRIQRLLGAGGMGEVYLAEDERLHRLVALKVLPAELADTPGRRARFEREASTAAALSHPNICTIYEVGEAEDRPFIAMEYVEGESLDARIARAREDVGRVLSDPPRSVAGSTGPGLHLNEILDIAIQIADALNDARRHHIVHRDLKSANILVTPRGQVKVLDFGLAKQQLPATQVRCTAATVEKLTQEGVVVGTIAYMAPEQALGQPIDHRSDIFSFGVGCTSC